LAYDQAQNEFDEKDLPPVNLAALGRALVVPRHEPAQQTSVADESGRVFAATESVISPWLTVDVATADARLLRLVDFASAGAAGTRYRSWLRALNPPPAPAFTQLPTDGARVPVGEVRFRWLGQYRTNMASNRENSIRYRVEFAANESFAPLLLGTDGGSSTCMTFNTALLHAKVGASSSWIYWRVVSIGANGETLPDTPSARFILDAHAPQLAVPPALKPGAKGEVIFHTLRGNEPPLFGKVTKLAGTPGYTDVKGSSLVTHLADGTVLNGRDQMLVYAMPVWPEKDFTVAVKVWLTTSHPERGSQIVSAWAAIFDDPIRLTLEGGKLSALIQSDGVFSTPGVDIAAGTWQHIAAVKQGGTLTLFVNGQTAGSCAVPEVISTQARDCFLGGSREFADKDFPANKLLNARLADFSLFARALTAGEIQTLAESRANPK
jgi:hypothetical protein